MLGAFLRLLILVAAGIVLSQIASLAIIALSGMDVSEPTISNLSGTTLRIVLLVGHLFTFILPCLAFLYLNYKDKKWELMRLNRRINLNLFLLCVLFCLVSYPAVTYSYTINSYLPLADWMRGQEDATAATLGKILSMDSPGVFLFNLIVIAIIPALGEELLFRGLIMDFIEKSSKNGHIAVWLSAAAFSLFHLQFQGFLPRLFLGALLGYSFLFTRNLWVPIILHFLNNAAPICSLYFFQEDLAAIDPTDTPPIHWLVGLGSALAGIAMAFYINKITKPDEA